ncbi:YopX family protein [Macrococcus psychrotolerans]|uniref:YopX family protein n=1 Tax=Macrococcus psychrotolerans TaxID=3039389 RepID=A0AAT9P8F6_9STAP|nr:MULTISPECIES: YopX family protein [Macrococcus]
MTPKYRMWLKCAELMQRVHAINFYQETAEWIFHDLVNQKEVIEEELFENIILMQSTGMIDENKAEVFQDDIVWHDQNEDYGVVEIDEAKFVIRWQDGYVEDLFERIDLLEVVGNIHEHSGLLKENGE